MYFLRPRIALVLSAPSNLSLGLDTELHRLNVVLNIKMVYTCNFHIAYQRHTENEKCIIQYLHSSILDIMHVTEEQLLIFPMERCNPTANNGMC